MTIVLQNKYKNSVNSYKPMINDNYKLDRNTIIIIVYTYMYSVNTNYNGIKLDVSILHLNKLLFNVQRLYPL